MTDESHVGCETCRLHARWADRWARSASIFALLVGRVPGDATTAALAGYETLRAEWEANTARMPEAKVVPGRMRAPRRRRRNVAARWLLRVVVVALVVIDAGGLVFYALAGNPVEAIKDALFIGWLVTGEVLAERWLDAR